MSKANGITWHPKLAKFTKATEKRLNISDVIVKPSFRIPYINTGSTILNILIGGSRLEDGSFVCPGYPKGKIIEIFGRESSGKSTFAMMAMGQACQQNGNSGCGLYVDLEHAVMDSYAIKLGCDFRPPELGGTGQAIRIAPHTFEETEAYVNIAALNGVDLIVIDSVAGLVSSREFKRDTTDEKQKLGVAEVPRLMSGWMPKLQDIIARTGTTVIFLNQTRDKIGQEVKFARTEEAKKSTTGGNALKFWASLRWLLVPKQSAKAKVWNPLIKETEEVPVATDVLVKNIKNKIDARQGHTGMVTLRYGVGIDEMRTMMNIAEAYGIVSAKKVKNKPIIYNFKDPETGSIVEANGIERFRLALKKNEVAFKSMNDLCVEKIMAGFKAIDDEQLAILAEDAVIVKEDNDDEYEDGGPPQYVDPEDMEVEEGNTDTGLSVESLSDES
jgi:recombination protein RecA